ncbi:ParA family protein [Amycolatopsis minnesotensis]|uniref:ParA family protein n=1 Tax=Amycolatopsis minnesotensis TaxID=337894 RepID=A0ABN2SB24_9PSEU
MAYRLTVCNNKGGVGKTNLVIQLAALLAMDHGLRVRVVDLDPQADSSAAFNFEINGEEDVPSVLDVIEEAYVRQRLVTGTAARAVRPCTWDVPWADKISYIPARFDLEEANHIAPNRDAFLRLRAAMTETDGDVDVILYDCPPSLGVLPQMAWADSDDVLLVTQPSFRSWRGMRRTRAQLLYVRDNLLVPDLDFCGFVVTAFREQTKNHQHWRERITTEFGEDKLWGTVPLRAHIARLDDQLKPVALLEDNAERDALIGHYRPIANRVHHLATTIVTQEI